MKLNFAQIQQILLVALGSAAPKTDEEYRQLLFLPSKIGEAEQTPAQMVENFVDKWLPKIEEIKGKNPDLAARIVGGQIGDEIVLGFVPAVRKYATDAMTMEFLDKVSTEKADDFINAIAENADLAADTAIAYYTGNENAVVEEYGQFFEATPEEVAAAIQTAADNAGSEAAEETPAEEEEVPAEEEEVPASNAEVSVAALLIQHLVHTNDEDLKELENIQVMQNILDARKAALESRGNRVSVIAEKFQQNKAQLLELFPSLTLPASVDAPELTPA